MTFILGNVNSRSEIQILICLFAKSVQCHLLDVKTFFLFQNVVDLVRKGFVEEEHFRHGFEGIKYILG